MVRVSRTKHALKAEPASKKKKRYPRSGNVPPGSVAIEVDGRVITVRDDDLASGEAAEGALRRHLYRAKKPIVVSSVEPLLDFSDDSRLHFLGLITSLKTAKQQVAFVSCGGQYDCLFDALLRLLPADTSTKWATKLERLAVETAVWLYADCLPLVCDRICKRLRELGYSTVQARDLLRKARTIHEQLRRASVQATQQQSPIKSVLPDAPVADDAVTPEGYSVTSEGVLRVIGDQRVPVSSAPILLTLRSRDIDSGSERLTVSWRRDGEWSSHTAARSEIADRGAIVGALANYGAPVTSSNSIALVEYIAAYELKMGRA